MLPCFRPNPSRCGCNASAPQRLLATSCCSQRPAAHVLGQFVPTSLRTAQLSRSLVCYYQDDTAPRTETLCLTAEQCISEEDGAVLVRDDLDQLLQLLPEDLREPLVKHPQRANLLEVVLDLGRRPEARFQGSPGGEYLGDAEITENDLLVAFNAVGEFGTDNRAGVAGTLHRISAIRNRRGAVVGLTCRVGRAVTGHTDMLKDLVESGHSVLLLGRPGVGKTTVIRELARVMADENHKRVVIVDTSNEIGGDGDVPHPAIGSARRMQVADAARQHHVMVEAVENHMPEVVIVDEIGSEAEALACRTIAERGVQLIGTAHGRVIENLIKNPTLSDLVGGVQSVTLGDEEARNRGTQKTIMERKAPPTFPIVVEIRGRAFYVAHWAEESVDALLQGKVPSVQVRERDPASHALKVTEVQYSQVTDPDMVADAGRQGDGWKEDYEQALREWRRTSLAQDGPAGHNESWTWGEKIKAKAHEELQLVRAGSSRSAFLMGTSLSGGGGVSAGKKSAPKKSRSR